MKIFLISMGVLALLLVSVVLAEAATVNRLDRLLILVDQVPELQKAWEKDIFFLSLFMPRSEIERIDTEILSLSIYTKAGYEQGMLASQERLLSLLHQVREYQRFSFGNVL